MRPPAGPAWRGRYTPPVTVPPPLADPSRGERVLWIVATAGFLLAASGDRVPWVRGPAPYPPEWQWPLREGAASGPLWPALAAVCAILGLLALSGTDWARTRPRQAQAGNERSSRPTGWWGRRRPAVAGAADDHGRVHGLLLLALSAEPHRPTVQRRAAGWSALLAGPIWPIVQVSSRFIGDAAPPPWRSHKACAPDEEHEGCSAWTRPSRQRSARAAAAASLTGLRL